MNDINQIQGGGYLSRGWEPIRQNTGGFNCADSVLFCFYLGDRIQVYTLLFFIPFNYDGSGVQEGREEA